MILPYLISTWPTFWRELYEERAGLMEVLGNLPRKEAEKFAEADIRAQAGGVERTNQERLGF